MVKSALILIALLLLIPFSVGRADAIDPTDDITLIARTIYNNGNLAVPDSVRVIVTLAGVEKTDAWYEAADAQCDAANDALVFFDQLQDIDGAGGDGCYVIQIGAYDDDSTLYTWYYHDFTVGIAALQVEVANIDGWNPITDNDSLIVDQSSLEDMTVATVTNGVTLADDAITTDKIAANAIGVSQIEDGTITAAKIADSAITVAKIKSDAITSAAIATNAIGADELATDAIGADEIDIDAIGPEEIATAAIDVDAIAANAIGASELASSAAAEIEDSVHANAADYKATVSAIIDSVNAILDTLQLHDTRLDSLLAALQDANIGDKVWTDGSFATRAEINDVLDSIQNQDNWVAKEATVQIVDDTLDAWDDDIALLDPIRDTVNAIIDTTQNQDGWIATAASLINAIDSINAILDSIQAGIAATVSVANMAAIADSVLGKDTADVTAGFGLMLKDTSAYQGSASGLTPTQVADTVWRRGFPGSPVAGSYEDSASGWGATSASDLTATKVADTVWGATSRTITGTGTDAITATSIAASAIGASELADSAITVAKIKSDAITSAAIAAAAITSDEIATNAIGSLEIGTGAIDADAIAADAIGSSELASTAAAEIEDSVHQQAADYKATGFAVPGDAMTLTPAERAAIEDSVHAQAADYQADVSALATAANLTKAIDSLNAVLDTLQAGFGSRSLIGDTAQGGDDIFAEVQNLDGWNPITDNDSLIIGRSQFSSITIDAVMSDVSIGTNSIGADELAATAISEILDSLFDTRTVTDTTMGTYLAQLIRQVKQSLDSLQSQDGWVAQQTEIENIDGWNPITDNDSLVVDKSSLPSYSTHSAADVWAVGTRTLTALGFTLDSLDYADSTFLAALFATSYWVELADRADSGASMTLAAGDYTKIADTADAVLTAAHGSGSWQTGGTGSGLYSVWFYAIDSTNDDTLSGVVLAVQNAAGTQLASGTTNDSGYIEMQIDGSVRIIASLNPAYYFDAATATITANDTINVLGYPNVIAAPTDPTLCRAHAYLHHINSEWADNIIVTVDRLGGVATNTTNGFIIMPLHRIDTSDVAGYFYFDLLQTQYYDDTTKGLYNFKGMYKNTVVFGIDSLIMPAQSTLDLTDSIAVRGTL